MPLNQLGSRAFWGSRGPQKNLIPYGPWCFFFWAVKTWWKVIVGSASQVLRILMWTRKQASKLSSETRRTLSEVIRSWKQQAFATCLASKGGDFTAVAMNQHRDGFKTNMTTNLTWLWTKREFFERNIIYKWAMFHSYVQLLEAIRHDSVTKGLTTRTDPSVVGVYMVYPLVICYIAMERSTIFHGKIHYFYSHFP